MLTDADERTLREELCAAAAVRINQLRGELHSIQEVSALLQADVHVKLAERRMLKLGKRSEADSRAQQSAPFRFSVRRSTLWPGMSGAVVA